MLLKRKNISFLRIILLLNYLDVYLSIHSTNEYIFSCAVNYYQKFRLNT